MKESRFLVTMFIGAVVAALFAFGVGLAWCLVMFGWTDWWVWACWLVPTFIAGIFLWWVHDLGEST